MKSELPDILNHKKNVHKYQSIFGYLFSPHQKFERKIKMVLR